MNKTTEFHISTVITGLLLAESELHEALTGEQLLAYHPTPNSPFITAITTIGEIADTKNTDLLPTEREQAQQQLLSLWNLLRYLRGGFEAALWDILSRAHERLSEVLTEEEAKLLIAQEPGVSVFLLDLDLRLGFLRPFRWDIVEQRWVTYDGRSGKYPASETGYAKHEILHLIKREREQKAHVTQ